jgi:hypothetical protein
VLPREAAAFGLDQVGGRQLHRVAHFLLLVAGVVLKGQTDAAAVGLGELPFPGDYHVKRVAAPLAGLAEALLEALQQLVVDLARGLGILQLDAHDLPRPLAGPEGDVAAFKARQIGDFNLVQELHIAHRQFARHAHPVLNRLDAFAQDEPAHFAGGLGIAQAPPEKQTGEDRRQDPFDHLRFLLCQQRHVAEKPHGPHPCVTIERPAFSTDGVTLPLRIR